MELKEFIKVTALFDGKPAIIRAACIDAVTDNAETEVDFGKKPACRSILYGGNMLDVTESLEELEEMIYNAEM